MYACPYERQAVSAAGTSRSLQLLARAFMRIGCKHPGHAHRTTSGACRPEQPGSGWQSVQIESRNHRAPNPICSHEKVLAVRGPGLCSRLHCFCRGCCPAEHAVSCVSMRCLAHHKSRTLVAFGILQASVMSLSWPLVSGRVDELMFELPDGYVSPLARTASPSIRMIVMTSTSEGCMQSLYRPESRAPCRCANAAI